MSRSGPRRCPIRDTFLIRDTSLLWDTFPIRDTLLLWDTFLIRDSLHIWDTFPIRDTLLIWQVAKQAEALLREGLPNKAGRGGRLHRLCATAITAGYTPLLEYLQSGRNQVVIR